MKQVKFLMEVASFIAVVPILVFARVAYSNTLQTLAVEEKAISRPLPAKKTVEAEQPPAVFPGLINSKFIILNY